MISVAPPTSLQTKKGPAFARLFLYVGAEGDSCVLYNPWLAAELYVMGYIWGYKACATLLMSSRFRFRVLAKLSASDFLSVGWSHCSKGSVHKALDSVRSPVPFFSASKLIRLSQDPGTPKRATHAQTMMPDLTSQMCSLVRHSAA